MSRRHEVAPERLPAPGERALLHLGGRCVVLFHVDGAYLAIDDRCPHQGASLAGGKLHGRSVQCPAHGLRFDLASGCMLQSAQLQVAVHPIEIEQGRVFLHLSDKEPS